MYSSLSLISEKLPGNFRVKEKSDEVSSERTFLFQQKVVNQTPHVSR